MNFDLIKNKTLRGNIVSLLSVQLMNYLIPLLLIPLLGNKLGREQYGVFALSQYISTFFILLCDYGFVYSGPLQVSANQKNHDYLCELFSVVTVIKLCLVAVTLFISSILIYFSSISQVEKIVFFFSFLAVFGNAITPLWFLQGIQNLKWYVIINFISKLLLIGSIFFLVDSKDDLKLTAIVFYSLSALTGISIFIYSKIKFSIRFRKVNFLRLKEEIKNSSMMFASVFFSSFYINGTAIILKFLSRDNSIIADFSVAEKIVRAVTYFFNPLTSAFLPFVSKIFIVDKQQGIYVFDKFLKLVILFTTITTVVLYFLSDVVLYNLFDKSYSNTLLFIYIMLPVIIAGNVASMIGNNLYFQLKMYKQNAFIMFILALLNTILCFVLINKFDGEGACWSLTFTEIIGAILFYGGYKYWSKRNNLN